MTKEKNNSFLHNLRYFPRTFFVIFTLLITTFPVAAIIYLLTFITKDQQLFTSLIRVWANFNLWVSGLKINVTGLENIDKKKQYIVIANHESALDIFLGIGKIPLQIRMVSKIGVKKLPIIGRLMVRLFFVFVDRTNTKESVKNLNETMKKITQHNISLFIFPEGSRRKNVPLLPFKKGAFVLGIKNNLPILPIIFRNTGTITPPDTIWVRKRKVDVDILPEVSTNDLNIKDLEKLRDKCYNIFKNNL